MDIIQDYASLLPRLLPPSLANPVLTLLTTTLGLARTLQAHLTPFLTRLITQPDVASILLLLVALFISMKVLDMMYRAVLFWINLALRLAFWGGVLALGMWVWTRGPEGFVEDVTGLTEYWLAEYRRFSGEVEGFRRQKEEQIRLQAARKGAGRGWR
ncbi:hypothetical protein IAQ61_006016 [Plenodomus lingam]|uniref:Nuclear pore assembly and biogenesis-domain-containing protein n=1 Tax=Leptosphaeria maculans (strain JN3 / isolate v23.1.3 / race Av1-4-5-6-7-8) TaxID=985895 RepID=E4ZMZ3_LEPMJ|nr:hypothetical protein LEMA_P053020.1 [Plenodomus lingam JN3]KAH9870540.1 hypothetical protein IAQ61_006016 [Plenodomus lingam]CBX92596.1 hypothetical protein LEMA_P053020.1 [Plenodomus lingam JN3]